MNYFSWGETIGYKITQVHALAYFECKTFSLS